MAPKKSAKKPAKKPAKKAVSKKKASKKKAPVKRTKKGKRIGRPPIKIDWKVFESLCGIFCTLTEIAHVLKCSEDTVERRVKRKYKENFAEVFKRLSSSGNSSLRREQMKQALRGNIAMLIWLGKQHLGQADKQARGAMGKDGELKDPEKKEKITPDMSDKDAEYIYIKTIRDRKKRK